MNIELRQYKISEIAENFLETSEGGVTAFGGKLDIRPPYQREFIYTEKQQKAVIETILKGYPLNVFYWATKQDGTYEVMDGQQRTLSFCNYIAGNFSINDRNFSNLTETEKNRIMNYEIMVYVCDGNDLERLEWFRTINIAGEKLTDQELLNINYTGKWLESAKFKFSKPNCVAYLLASKYVKGSPIRQEFLETAIDWISGGNIASYMASHQYDDNANELWLHFQNVIAWVSTVFPTYYREMKGIDWGRLYTLYHEKSYGDLDDEVKRLMADDDVTKKSGIFEYLLSNYENEKCLNIRTFTDTQKRIAYENQDGVCPVCGRKFDISEMEADHITPWSEGGKTSQENLQMLCKHCNRLKSNK